MSNRALRVSTRWLLRAIVVIAFATVGRSLGWKWAGDIILAVLFCVVLEFLIRAAVLVARRPLDRRRGLAVREWAAIRIMGNFARTSDKANFDHQSLARTKNADSAILIGYATILANRLILDRLGPHPTDSDLDHLAAECFARWRAVIRQPMANLVRLVHQAAHVEQGGMPKADWDNIRGMAALTGLLRSRRFTSNSLRHAVAAEYAAKVALDNAHSR